MSTTPAEGKRIDQKLEIWLVVVLFLVCVKFVYPLFSSSIPLGYDAGINRYLFLKYAETFPLLPELSSWAKEHPPFLFYLWAPFIRLGVPVDWVIGWIWNLFCMLLLGVFASVIGKRNGVRSGVLLLFFGLLSQAYFDGYSSMYWKNYLALLFAVGVLHFLEKRSPWALGLLFLCLITHHQTSLLLVLSVATWWLIEGKRCGFRSKSWLHPTAAAVCAIAIGSSWYLLSHFSFVMEQFRLILAGGAEVYGGAFPPVGFYLRTMPVVMLFGLAGFLLSFRKERGTPWQIIAAWSAFFVIFKFYFHRRFFLDLDFFLLPFAAYAFETLLVNTSNTFIRAVVYVLLIAQTALSLAGITYAKPVINRDALEKIISVRDLLEKDALVIVPENQSAPFVLGWIPSRTVVAPGLYDFGWTQDVWNDFVFGSASDRLMLLSRFDVPVYIAVTPSFFRMYDSVTTENFLADPCLVNVSDSSLLKFVCR